MARSPRNTIPPMPPKLTNVEAMDAGRVLRFKLKNSGWREVDLEGFISRIQGLAALKDEHVFAKAEVIDWGLRSADRAISGLRRRRCYV